MVASTETIIFVSDSKDSFYADKALIGTSYYKIFLEYLDVLHLSVNDVLLYTDKDFRTVEAIAVEDKNVKIVALGKDSEDCLRSTGIPYTYLPLHVSDLSTLELDLELQKAGDFINDYSQQ